MGCKVCKRKNSIKSKKGYLYFGIKWYGIIIKDCNAVKRGENKEVKAVIITLHRIYNYGSVLQAYATQRIFQEAGIETQIVDYVTEQRTLKRIFLNEAAGSNRKMKSTLYYFLKIFSIALKELTFGSFIRHNLNLTKKYVTEKELMEDPPKADVYVTGSDQTWNDFYNEGIDKGFFLDYAPKDKIRVAFVASFGKEKLEPEELLEIDPYIKKYSLISVREDAALKILAELHRDDAIQLIDPTLQIKKEVWNSLASHRLIKEKYLILMLLYNEDNHATEYAKRIADKKGLKLVKLSWELKKPPLVDKLYTHRSPADFLSLFSYADFVVTNSFHGLAFSVNFQKQFIVVRRKEFNSRIDSLLRLLGLEERAISNYEQLKVVEDNINYVPVVKILEIERRRASDFVNQIVHEVTNK